MIIILFGVRSWIAVGGSDLLSLFKETSSVIQIYINNYASVIYIIDGLWMYEAATKGKKSADSIE